MQRIAAAAVEDGLTHPDIRFMGRLGNNGNNPGQCRRQLYNKLREPKLQRAVARITLPFKRGFNQPKQDVEVSCASIVIINFFWVQHFILHVLIIVSASFSFHQVH